MNWEDIFKPLDDKEKPKIDVYRALRQRFFKSVYNVNSNFSDISKYSYGFIGVIISIIQITVFLGNLIIWPNDPKSNNNNNNTSTSNTNNANSDANTNDGHGYYLNVLEVFFGYMKFIYSFDISNISFYLIYGLINTYICLVFLLMLITMFKQHELSYKIFGNLGYFHRFFGYFITQYVLAKVLFGNLDRKMYFEAYSNLHIGLMAIGIYSMILNVILALVTNHYYFNDKLFDSLANFHNKESSFNIKIQGLIACLANIPLDDQVYNSIGIMTLMFIISISRLYLLATHLEYYNLKMTKLRGLECLIYMTVITWVYIPLMLGIDNEHGFMLFSMGIFGLILTYKSFCNWVDNHQNMVIMKKSMQLKNEFEAIMQFYMFQGLSMYGLNVLNEFNRTYIHQLILNGIMKNHYLECGPNKDCNCGYRKYLARKLKPENDIYEKSIFHFTADSDCINDFCIYLLNIYLHLFPNSINLKLHILQYYIESSKYLHHKGYTMIEDIQAIITKDNLTLYIEYKLYELKNKFNERIQAETRDVNTKGLDIMNLILYTELQHDFLILLEKQIFNMNKFWSELLKNAINMKKLYQLTNNIFQENLIIEKYWDRILDLVNKRSEQPYLIYGLYMLIANNSSMVGEKLMDLYKHILTLGLWV